MKLEDLIGILILSTWLGMLALEALFPARSYPKVRGWRFLGAFALLAFMAISTVMPLLLPPALFEHTWLQLGDLSPVLGAPLGFAAVTFVGYLYHRLCHRFGFMWRWLHQLHHSAPRLDIGGAMMFHPLEMGVYGVLQPVILVSVLGLSPESAALAGFIAAFYSLFQHLNVRTPTWLGYLIQRPESHGLHHEQGVHAYNYGDLPLWDMLFGTFRNPARFTGDVGFGGNEHRRVFSMLFGRDVSQGTGTRALRDANGARSVPDAVNA